MHEYNTVQDLEDLPTTWGGYDAAYAIKILPQRGLPDYCDERQVS